MFGWAHHICWVKEKKLAEENKTQVAAEVPEPINIEKLFNEISTDIDNQEPDVPNDTSVKYQSQDIPQESSKITPEQDVNVIQKPVHMTKREYNLQISDTNQRVPEHMKNTVKYQSQDSQKLVSKNPQIIEAALGGSNYMDVTNFNQNSYMLMWILT